MLTPRAVLDYVKAEPFRPFRIRMASGRTFDIRHQELIKVMRSYFHIYKVTRGDPEIPDETETVSLMLSESISYLDAPVSS